MAASSSASRVAHMLYVFDKSGNCLYYQEWSRKRNLLSDQPEEDQKLMFGMLFSFKHLCQKMSPNSDQEEGVSMYTTSSYNLHHLEVPTGFHFVLATSKEVLTASSTLARLYREAFVPFVVLNPFQDTKKAIKAPAFVHKVNTLVAELCVG